MNVFEAVKQSVSTREVAEMYGIKVRRNGMAYGISRKSRSSYLGE